MKHQLGFTLIELLVTISIVGLVFGVVASAANNAKPTTRDAERQADLKTIQGLLQRYYSDQVYYPKTTDFPAAGGILSKGSIIYTQDMPGDPTGAYKYEAQSSSGGSCDNLTTMCAKYCLGAALEQVAGSTSCDFSAAADNTTYNLRIGPPQ